MSEKKQLLPCHAAHVSVEIEINASVEKTWRHMIEDIGQWWRQDFLVCEASKGMRLEPRLGGLVFEETGNGGCGFAWGHIISFQPHFHLGYIAQIVPPWGGPAQSVVQITLKESGGGGTQLTLTDSIIGHLSDDLVSSLDGGWRQLYGEGGLKSFVEAR